MPKFNLSTLAILLTSLTLLAGHTEGAIISIGGEADTVLSVTNGVTSAFSIASLGPGLATVHLHDLDYNPLTNNLFVMTNGGLFERRPDGSFLNTNILPQQHGHEHFAFAAEVPEPNSIMVMTFMLYLSLPIVRQKHRSVAREMLN